MKSKRALFVFTLSVLAVSAGCTFPSKNSLYDRSAAGRTMNVDLGKVVDVRDVQVSGRQTVVGVGGGGLMGRAAASGGSGVGGAVAQAAGAIGGAIVGEAVEEAATRRTAQEITIKLNNGDTIAVVQELKSEGRFAVGENVQVMQGSGGTQVRRMY